MGIDTTFTGTTGTGQSRFQAVYKLWTGLAYAYIPITGSVGLWGTASGKSVRIYGTNKSNKVVYLCGTDFSPYVHITGSPIATPESTGSQVAKVYAVAEDPTSQELYGTRTLEISNDYISNFEYADNLAKYLVLSYKDPRPRLEGVSIMADPRLELGDRVTVQDSAGATGLDADFWVTGIDSKAGAPYTQDLKLDYVTTTNWFILDHATQGRLDCNVLAF